MDDVVRISPDFGTNPRWAWLGLVTEVRGLVGDYQQLREEDGTLVRDSVGAVKRDYSTAYVGLKWLYARQDFDALKTDNKNVTQYATPPPVKLEAESVLTLGLTRVGSLYSRELPFLGPNEWVWSRLELT